LGHCTWTSLPDYQTYHIPNDGFFHNDGWAAIKHKEKKHNGKTTKLTSGGKRADNFNIAKNANIKYIMNYERLIPHMLTVWNEFFNLPDGYPNNLNFLYKVTLTVPKKYRGILISNPMYYWDEDVGSNRYNGYGNWSTTYDADGQGNHFTILGGVYLPGEHCYLIINTTHGAFGHWALLPQRKINPESGQIISDDSGLVDLKHYDVSTQSVRWGEPEWTDEGWDNDKSPTRY